MSGDRLMEAFEPRRLFTFAFPDASLGSRGVYTFGDETEATKFGDTASLVTLEGGGAVLIDADRASFVRSDGRLDGSSGSRHVDLPSLLVNAVDPRTGDLAIVRSAGKTNGFILSTYEHLRNVPNYVETAGTTDRGRPTAVAFTPDGGLVVVSLRNVSSSTSVTLRADVYRFDKGGRAVKSFGTNGRATIDLLGKANTRTQNDRAELGELLVDDKGRVYLAATIYDVADAAGTGTRRNAVYRLTSAGKLDAGFGDAHGAVTLAAFSGKTTLAPLTVDDLAVSGDGQLHVLTTNHGLTKNGAPNITVTAMRFDPSGKAHGTTSIGRASHAPIGTPSLAIAPDGSTYVANVRTGGGGEIYHLTATDFTIDTNFSAFGDYRATPTHIGNAPQIAIDSKGKLWIRDGLTVHYFSGAAEDFNKQVAPSASTLLGDGTLVLRGGDGPDNIQVGTRFFEGGSGQVVVTRGGVGSEETFDVNAVRGIVILAGAGDDTVTSALSAYIDGGTGNDTISGNGASVTLIGGAGNDRLTGGNQSDQLYGQDGNDTLLGGHSSDELFGGKGDDLLYARDLSNKDDYAVDDLYGGAGHDRVQLNLTKLIWRDIAQDFDDGEDILAATKAT